MYMLSCAVTNFTLKLCIHTKEHLDDKEMSNKTNQLTKLDHLTSDMCKMLYNTGLTINMDNYYMSTTCALHLKNNGVYCRGTICSNQKFVPKSTLFMASEARSLPCESIRYAVNPTHNLISVGWLDNKAVNFISTADTTAVKAVKCRITNDKVEVAALEIVVNYNKYMGVMDQHDRLQSSFSLSKAHKFKKYYVKLLLFLMDVALTNAWVYYSLANPDEANKDGARADFFVTLGGQLVKQNIDWESKYKNNTKEMLMKGTDIIDEIIPTALAITKEQQQKNDKFLISATGEECLPMAFSSIPFPLNLCSKTYQVR